MGLVIPRLKIAVLIQSICNENTLPHSTSVFTGVLLLVFFCAVQEGVLVMGQVVGAFHSTISCWP